VVRTAEVGEQPGSLSLTPDGAQAWFVRPYGSTVEVLDTATLELIDSIPVGAGPSVVTVSP
jgi:YVTN family beta-propeller protein